MKKKIIIISAIILFVIIALVGIALATKQNNDTSEYLIQLDRETLEEKINNQDSFILVISRDSCSHCAEYLPVLQNVLEDNKIVGYYIDLATLSDDDTNYLYDIANISGTPTTVFIEDGEEKTVVNRIVGSASRKTIEERLKTLGYLE